MKVHLHIDGLAELTGDPATKDFGVTPAFFTRRAQAALLTIRIEDKDGNVTDEAMLQVSSSQGKLSLARRRTDV